MVAVYAARGEYLRSWIGQGVDAQKVRARTLWRPSPQSDSSGDRI